MVVLAGAVVRSGTCCASRTSENSSEHCPPVHAYTHPLATTHRYACSSWPTPFPLPLLPHSCSLDSGVILSGDFVCGGGDDFGCSVVSLACESALLVTLDVVELEGVRFLTTSQVASGSSESGVGVWWVSKPEARSSSVTTPFSNERKGSVQ